MELLKNQVVSCVERGLVATLGASGKSAIAFHLSSNGVTLADSFDQPAKFVEVLRRIFGAGSVVLETRFAECIGALLPVDVKGKNFSDVVIRIRESKRGAS